jgi:hypothetical protein
MINNTAIACGLRVSRYGKVQISKCMISRDRNSNSKRDFSCGVSRCLGGYKRAILNISGV